MKNSTKINEYILPEKKNSMGKKHTLREVIFDNEDASLGLLCAC